MKRQSDRGYPHNCEHPRGNGDDDVHDRDDVRDRDGVHDRDDVHDRDQNHLQSPYLSPRGEGEHQNQFPKLRSLRRDERGGGNHPLPVSRVLCEEARHLPQGPQEDH